MKAILGIIFDSIVVLALGMLIIIPSVKAANVTWTYVGSSGSYKYYVDWKYAYTSTTADGDTDKAVPVKIVSDDGKVGVAIFVADCSAGFSGVIDANGHFLVGPLSISSVDVGSASYNIYSDLCD